MLRTFDKERGDDDGLEVETLELGNVKTFELFFDCAIECIGGPEAVSKLELFIVHEADGGGLTSLQSHPPHKTHPRVKVRENN
jgi:hypothetical protein